jgi:transglutaminase-like putative cysteine protease
MAALWSSFLPVQVFDDHLVIDLVDYPVLDPRVSAKQRRPSFLVDFEEPAVRDFAARMRRKLGKKASRGELARVVDEEISTKTRARGFDMASTVARRHEGDCTEHAVLLAALARARGLPARVVMGVAIVVGTDEVAAFGHAWTEIYEGTKWHRADATRIHKRMREQGKRVRYLPVLMITDEGPGYEFKYVSALQARWFDRLEVLGNAPQADAD